MSEGTLGPDNTTSDDPIIIPAYIRETRSNRQKKTASPRKAEPKRKAKRPSYRTRYIDTNSAFTGRSAKRSAPHAAVVSDISSDQVWTALISFFAALIMARAQWNGLAPFAASFFVAGILSGLMPSLMLAGCAVGAITLGSAAVMWSPLVCACLWMTSRFWKQSKAHTIGSVFGISSITIFISGTGLDIAYGLFGCAVAALTSWLFIEALSVQVRGRRVLSQEEMAGAALLVSALALGLYGVDLYIFKFGEAFSVFVIICCAVSGGMGSGAACGVVMGVALTLGGAYPMICINLAVCGLMAGLFKWTGRGIACIVFFLCNALITLYINPQSADTLSIYAVLVASACVIATPASFFNTLSLFLDEHSGQEKRRQDFAAQARTQASSRLSEYASIFMSMSEAFSQPAQEPPQGIEAAKRALCDGCHRHEICWSGASDRVARVLEELALVVEQQGTITASDIPKTFSRDCIRPDDIARKLAPVFAQQYADRLKREHDRRAKDILSRQLEGMARSVSSFADTFRTEIKLDDEAARAIREELDKAGIITSDATVHERSDRLCAQVTLSSCGARGLCGKEAADIISRVLGTEMRTADPCCSMGECTVTYEQAPALAVVTGISRLPKVKGPCGDSFTFSELRDGRYMLTLCDGMGSGEQASRESAAVASMLEQFFHAGFDQREVFETINRLMLLKSDSEIFTTVDMCLLDLNASTAEFIKIGAERSIIKRGNQVKAIGEGALPLGILDELAPQSEKVGIFEGDMIILFTDGISDAGAIGRDANPYFNFDWVLEAAANIHTQNPQEMADALMDAALERSSPMARDDMTVMVTRVYARQG